MASLIYNVFYVFFVVLEIILFLYVLSTWFAVKGRLKDLLLTLLEPMLVPVRYLLKHSIFNTPAADLSPVICFIIIIFLQEIFYSLSKF